MQLQQGTVAFCCLVVGCLGLSSEGRAQTPDQKRTDREKRQTLPQLLPGTGCVDPALVQYLLYYYLVAAQAGQPQAHLQADQMAAALLRLVRTRGTDPLPTLVSQTAGQAALVAMLQKVAENDTARLVLLLTTLREMVPKNGGTTPAPPATFGVNAQRPQPVASFGGAVQTTGRPTTGPGSSPFAGGSTGFTTSGSAGFNNAAQPAVPNTVPQAATAFGLDSKTESLQSQPHTSNGAAGPGRVARRYPADARDQELIDPEPSSPPPAALEPSTAKSQILPPTTRTEVSISTLVTTILIPRTSTAKTVIGGIVTDVAHVRTVTHVVTATRPVTETIVVTPTLVAYGPDRTSTIYRSATISDSGNSVRTRRSPIYRGDIEPPGQQSAMINANNFRTPPLPSIRAPGNHIHDS